MSIQTNYERMRMSIQQFVDRAVKSPTFDRDACCGSLWLDYRLSTAACERIADYIIADRDTLALAKLANHIPALNAPLHFPFTHGFYTVDGGVAPHFAQGLHE